MASSRGLRRRDEALAVQGLTELQRALRRAEGDVAKDLRGALREIADDVRDTARRNVTNRTGRHGNDGPRLASTIRTSVTATGAAIYSNAPHSIVQDVGGKVGRGRLTLLKRDEVSKYMSRAVAGSRDEVERQVDRVLDRLERDFER